MRRMTLSRSPWRGAGPYLRQRQAHLAPRLQQRLRPPLAHRDGHALQPRPRRRRRRLGAARHCHSPQVLHGPGPAPAPSSPSPGPAPGSGGGGGGGGGQPLPHLRVKQTTLATS